jgi:hypothetical protein
MIIVEASHWQDSCVSVNCDPGHRRTLAAARAALHALADGLVHLFIDREPDSELGALGECNWNGQRREPGA